MAHIEIENRRKLVERFNDTKSIAKKEKEINITFRNNTCLLQEILGLNKLILKMNRNCELCYIDQKQESKFYIVNF